MGEVYEARRIDLGDRVAVKLLHERDREDPELRARFLREAQTLARVASPHVVRIVDFSAAPGEVAYMAMEYLEGQNAGELLRLRGAFSVREVGPLAMQMFAGLAAVHAVGLVHRDIKPQNLMIVDGGPLGPIVKIVDFGLAKTTEGDDKPITHHAGMLGTPSYMAPEQVGGNATIDARADVYGAAATFLALATGKTLYDERGKESVVAAMLEGRRLRVAEVAPELGVPLCTCLERALAADRNMRHARIEELASDVERGLAALGDTGPGTLAHAPALGATGHATFATGPSPTLGGAPSAHGPGPRVPAPHAPSLAAPPAGYPTPPREPAPSGPGVPTLSGRAAPHSPGHAGPPPGGFPQSPAGPPSGGYPIPQGHAGPPSGGYPLSPAGPPSGGYPLRSAGPPSGGHPVPPGHAGPPSGGYPLSPGHAPAGGYPLSPRHAGSPSGGYPLTAPPPGHTMAPLPAGGGGTGPGFVPQPPGGAPRAGSSGKTIAAIVLASVVVLLAIGAASAGLFLHHRVDDPEPPSAKPALAKATEAPSAPGANEEPSPDEPPPANEPSSPRARKPAPSLSVAPTPPVPSASGSGRPPSAPALGFDPTRTNIPCTTDAVCEPHGFCDTQVGLCYCARARAYFKPYLFCGGKCVEQTNQRCGSCTTACAADATCIENPATPNVMKCGECKAQFKNAAICNTRCVNLDNDFLNCGRCGHSCPAEAACKPKGCICSAGACKVLVR